MAGRRTNLALLVFLVVALATGLLAYSAGTGWGSPVVIAHGIVGFAIVVLSPWKSVIARRGFSRRRRGKIASTLFSILVVAALISGILHATGVLRSFGVVTAMQVHVGAALLAIPVAVGHIRARPVRTDRADLSRRAVLRGGMLVGSAGLAYLAVEGIARLVPLPGRRRRFTGSYETGSFAPDEMPVTQWFNDSVPGIDASVWRLRVRTGSDERTFSYDDVARFDEEVSATLDCTGGWYAAQNWGGIRFDRLLGLVDPSYADAGRSISVASVTGYGRRFPLRDAASMWLVTQAGGEQLSEGHGFPARVVAPGRRGFWWVKWVERIEVSDIPWWRQWPFPPT
jgi:DMSO/TMAO reductase YedYZ molybdopterin-dependent catalytic subunit